MRRVCPFVVALSLLVVLTVAVWAQEDSFSWSGTVGSEATVYPYLADYSWISLYLDLAGFTLSSATGLSVASPVSISQVFGLAYGWNWLTLGSKLYLGVYPFPPSLSEVKFYTEATPFDVPLGEPPDGSSFSGGIGASVAVYPSVTGDFWFDLSLNVDGFSIASETAFSVAPFAFSQQRFDLGYGFGFLSTYVWGAVSHGWSPSAGVGVYIGFP